MVFAALLHDLIAQAFERYNRQGAPIDPRLLVVLDEAANTPLPKLPQWAATITGAGIQLVTVWQSKAQLDQAYGKDADNVLTNHRTKLIFPSGLSDLSTIEYISALVGDEHVRSELEEPRGRDLAGKPPTRSPSTAVAYLAPSTLRRVRVGDALALSRRAPASVDALIEQVAAGVGWRRALGLLPTGMGRSARGRANTITPRRRRGMSAVLAFDGCYDAKRVCCAVWCPAFNGVPVGEQGARRAEHLAGTREVVVLRGPHGPPDRLVASSSQATRTGRSAGAGDA